MKTQIEKIQCDCCGKEIEKVADVGEYFTHAIMKITFDVWYGGVREIKDICVECNKKIVMFLYDNDMLDNARRINEK